MIEEAINEGGSAGILLNMFDAFFWPPIFVPLAVSVAICFGAGALFSRVWIGLLLAELFSILGLAFIYVVGGSLLNDALSVSSFLVHGYFGLAHILAFASFSAPVLVGYITRQLLNLRRRSLRVQS